MESKLIDRAVDMFALIVIGIVLIFTIARLFFGVDLTDEAYTVAETYMVANGALPFVNNWSQMPGYTLLLAPFVKIYTWAVGGTEGIVLFFRFLAFSINALTAIAVSWLLKDYIKNRILLALLSMIYVGATGWDGGVAFRGDSLAIDLLAVGVLLIVRFFVNPRFNEKLLFLSGSLLSLSVLSYPTLVIVFVFLAVAVFVLCRKRHQGIKAFVCFLLGASLAAFTVIAYLSVHSGVFEIFVGIQYLLKDVAYFRLANQGIAKLFPYCKDMTKQFLWLLLFSATSFMGLMVVNRRKMFKTDYEYFSIKRIYLHRLALVSLLMGVCLYHFGLIWKFKNVNHMYISLYAMAIESLMVPFVWYFVPAEERFCKYLLGFVWFPVCIWVFATGVLTYDQMLVRHRLLKNAAFLLGIMVYFALCYQFRRRSDCYGERQDSGAIWFKGMTVIFVTVIAFTYLFNSYSFVYRDESVRLLDTVVPEGPYRGLWTTKMRVEGLLTLDKMIDSLVSKEDYILAMDNNPFIYLMAGGRICTPSTWDQASYSHGFNQPDLYFDYFKVTGTEPSKIIYFNYGFYKRLSIDNEYKFNNYVKSHYKLVYENRDLFRWRYCGKDSAFELLVFSRVDKGK